jgi:hypothetical protein
MPSVAFSRRNRPGNILQLCATAGFQRKAMETNSSNPNESLWRRTPSDAELSELRVPPEVEFEAKLTSALSKLPDAPVPSNFTARVLESVERAERQAEWSRRRWSWRYLVPRIAVATAVLVLAGLGIQRYEKNSHRATLAREVAAVAATQPLPAMDILENLEVIRRMGEAGHADGELLAALQ